MGILRWEEWGDGEYQVHAVSVGVSGLFPDYLHAEVVGLDASGDILVVITVCLDGAIAHEVELHIFDAQRLEVVHLVGNLRTSTWMGRVETVSSIELAIFPILLEPHILQLIVGVGHRAVGVTAPVGERTVVQPRNHVVLLAVSHKFLQLVLAEVVVPPGIQTQYNAPFLIVESMYSHLVA